MGEAGDTGPAHPSLSPVGDRVAMTRGQGGNPDVWLMDVTSGRASRFTLDPSTEIYPIWSPDGSRIVYGSNRRGRRGLELYQKSTATSDPDELLTTFDGLTTVMPDDWSPDGGFVIFRGLGDPKSSFDLWALPLKGPGKPFAVVQTEFEERDAQFSSGREVDRVPLRRIGSLRGIRPTLHEARSKDTHFEWRRGASALEP